jgi:hypothetical protein
VVALETHSQNFAQPAPLFEKHRDPAAQLFPPLHRVPATLVAVDRKAPTIVILNPGEATSHSRIVMLISNYTYIILSPYIGGTYMGPNVTVIPPVGS